ncbi:hypothetical protein Lfu02_04180 [Longispora fulva]|uniref:IPT/TIG domain-containing protein n=1 Tax=Longispora fulva TaxID=619741 RepID=A0A8J7GC53_9ACTN|nr:IPT/TIG domain-containing protein [Longispora fulva]MBG6135715.1 hypothetical protein [Longispora fulva]GIG56046.1 hypothetical protein Lfu02_04180 [Longispora fulva]
MQPTVTSVEPAGGYPGDIVVLRGTGLTGATAVMFGTAPAPNVFVDDDSQITLTVPPGDGTAGVTVTTPDGTSDPMTFAYGMEGGAVEQPDAVFAAAGSRGRLPTEHVILVGGPSNWYNGFGKEIEDPPGSEVEFELNPPPVTVDQVNEYINANLGNVTHDKYWGSFLEPVPRLFERGLATPRPGDIVTIIVFYPPFGMRNDTDWEASPYNPKWRGSPWVLGRSPYDPRVRASQQGAIPTKTEPTPKRTRPRPSMNTDDVDEDRIDHEILMRCTSQDRRPGQTYEMRPTRLEENLDHIYELPRRLLKGPTFSGASRLPGVLVKLLMITDASEAVDYISHGLLAGQKWVHALDAGGSEEDQPDLEGPGGGDYTRTWFVAFGVPPNSAAARYWDDAAIDRSKVKISRFDYFGHSSSDAFFLQYGWKNVKGDPTGVRGEAIITKDRLDERLADARAFAPGAVAHLWGCYLADDMAPVLRKYVSKVIAAEGRTDYEGLVGNPAALPVPADQGSWTVLAAADPDPAVPV